MHKLRNETVFTDLVFFHRYQTDVEKGIPGKDKTPVKCQLQSTAITFMGALIHF